MATNKDQAHALVDRIPPDQIDSAVRFLEFLLLDPVARAAALAPLDDEPVTEEDALRIREAQSTSASENSGTPMVEVLAEFGLTMDDFPQKQ